MTVLFTILVHLVLFCAALFQLVLIVFLIFRYDPHFAETSLKTTVPAVDEIEAREERRDKLEFEIDTLERKHREAHTDDDLDPELRKMRRQLERLEGDPHRELFNRLQRHKGPSRSGFNLVNDYPMRAVAAITGLLLYLGARATGVSIPSLAYEAMSNAFPMSIFFNGLLFPSLIGFIVSWFLIKHLNEKNQSIIAIRVLVLVMSLVFFIYTDSYFFVFSSHSTTIHFLPNVVFVLSALLYAVFKYRPLPVNQNASVS